MGDYLGRRLAKGALLHTMKLPSESVLMVITPRSVRFSKRAWVRSVPIAIQAVAHASAVMQSGATTVALSRVDSSLLPVKGFTMCDTFLPFTSLNLR